MPNKRAGLGVKIPITWCFRVHIFNKSKVRLLVYRPHSHKKIAQSFYKVCILTQRSSISSKIAKVIVL